MTGYKSKRAAAQDKLAQPEQEQDATMQSLKDLWRSVCDGVGKAAFAQPAQEPESVTYKEVQGSMNALEKGDLRQQVIAEEVGKLKLYTHPPQRPWVGLTDEEAQLIYDMGRTPTGMMEMVEAKLKEKNT